MSTSKLIDLMSELEIGSIWQSKSSPKNINQIVSGIHSDVYFPGWYRMINGRKVHIPHGELECRRCGIRYMIVFKRLMSSDPKYINTWGSCEAGMWSFYNKRIGWSDPLVTRDRLYPDLSMVGRLREGETFVV